MTFPNPCPVCGADDEHAAWAETVTGSPCTFCPHPGEPGHGTGCSCAGRSQPWGLRPFGMPLLTAEQEAQLKRDFDETMRGPNILYPSRRPFLSRDTVRQLLRECVTIVKPGEVLFFTAGDPNMTPTQMRELQDFINWWLEVNAPDVKVLVLPHGEMAAAESGSD